LVHSNETRATSLSIPAHLGKLRAVKTLGLASALVAAAALLGCDATLPQAPPHANVAAVVHAPPMELCWLEYATDHQPANYGLAGSSDAYQWSLTFSGLLIRHPKGDLLIEVGNSTHFTEEIETSGFKARQLQKSFQGAGARVATAPEALRQIGEDPARLHGIILSHLHADHAGGIMDVPNVPILLSAEEAAFGAKVRDEGTFDVVRAQEIAIAGRARPIQLTSGPYENFDRSFDYYGDGSIVFVPLFGHTPGSMGTFVNRSPSERYFHVGDAVNLLEAIEKRRGKSFLLSVTDHDSGSADQVVAKLTQLRAQTPNLVFVPAHDRSAWIKAFGSPGRCLPPR
jgi:glyoxylase-like metal-dependent hydrolase (beta-lactamase superfamily II)